MSNTEKKDELGYYSYQAVANNFIRLASKSDKIIDPLKLQKLIYFAQGWHLALTDKPLINQPFYAWKFGPVISELYHQCKNYRREPIRSLLTQTKLSPNGEFIEETPLVEVERSVEIINLVFDKYGHISGGKLSAMSHIEGSPWCEVFDEKIEGNQIRNDAIKDYFKGLFEKKVWF
jgi:uncharacterized phage-associated protein